MCGSNIKRGVGNSFPLVIVLESSMRMNCHNDNIETADELLALRILCIARFTDFS